MDHWSDRAQTTGWSGFLENIDIECPRRDPLGSTKQLLINTNSFVFSMSEVWPRNFQAQTVQCGLPLCHNHDEELLYVVRASNTLSNRRHRWWHIFLHREPSTHVQAMADLALKIQLPSRRMSLPHRLARWTGALCLETALNETCLRSHAHSRQRNHVTYAVKAIQYVYCSQADWAADLSDVALYLLK